MPKHSKEGPLSARQRKKILAERRDLKMASSVHAYVRGNTTQFYEWLSHLRPGRLPEGPPVWICGDCHSGNLGPVASDDGEVEVRIRDLDQSVIGNPIHDIVRLGLSLAMAVRGSDLPGVTTARMLEQLIRGYKDGLRAHRKKQRVSDAAEPIQILLKKALRRRWKHLAEERIHDTKPSIPLGRRFWPISKRESKAIKQLIRDPQIRDLVGSDNPIKVVDSAYWVRGCSSLGHLRYAVLVRVGDKKHETTTRILDIKESLKALAPRYSRASIPRDDGSRIVEGATQLAPSLGNRMRAGRILGRSVVIRELLPQDLKLELGRLRRAEVSGVAHFLGAVVGQAHGRQMDTPTRRSWARELATNWTTSLNAPSWLWSSVVDLAGAHEVGYLEHCRRLAAHSHLD